MWSTSYPTHLPNCDVFELGGEREDTKELDLAEGRLHKLVVCCHGFTRDVVVAGNATQVGHLWEEKPTLQNKTVLSWEQKSVLFKLYNTQGKGLL